ncbi:alpha/beta fold hydrolase [Nonomuraea terrae]|uniref:alpha/beta fold hydrolase n=1 Tax=Nonomuraea terrae TaxID=2530383 RepID=UPI0037ACA696
MRFVLVHGGWQGGWCWDAVAARLRAEGHEVFAPTLRGLAEGEVDRAGVDLTAAGEGLVAAIEERDLTDLVLVGHSGGGPVIQYAADRLADRTRRVVFVSAWVLHDGEAIHDVLPRPLVEGDRAAAAQRPDRTILMDPGVWKAHFMNGATDEQVAAVADRLVPQPLGWLTEPISLPRFWTAEPPSSYVFLRDDRGVPMELYREMAGRLTNPRVVECDGPHEAMLTHPEALADALVTAAHD